MLHRSRGGVAKKPRICYLSKRYNAGTFKKRKLDPQKTQRKKNANKRKKMQINAKNASVKKKPFLGLGHCFWHLSHGTAYYDNQNEQTHLVNIKMDMKIEGETLKRWGFLIDNRRYPPPLV